MYLHTALQLLHVFKSRTMHTNFIHSLNIQVYEEGSYHRSFWYSSVYHQEGIRINLLLTLYWAESVAGWTVLTARARRSRLVHTGTHHITRRPIVAQKNRCSSSTSYVKSSSTAHILCFCPYELSVVSNHTLRTPVEKYKSISRNHSLIHLNVIHSNKNLEIS
jgi:hypothetical protein